jgi:putative flippase GtrA
MPARGANLGAVDSLTALWDGHGVKLMRYCGVSVVNVVLGQSLLAFFLISGLQAAVANLAAIAVGTVPSYLLARKYVWEKTGRHSIRGEVLPFWGLNLLGTILSTLSTHYAQVWWGSKALIMAASISAWFVVWVVKYVLLDKAIFKDKVCDAAAAAAA